MTKLTKRNLLLGSAGLLAAAGGGVAAWLRIGIDTYVSEPDLGRDLARAPEPLAQPGYRASLYPTAWPADMANLNRTNAVVGAGLPREARAEDIAVDTVEMPFPVFAYTRDDDEVFVLGGSAFVLDQYVSNIDGLPKGRTRAAPHLTKLNPFTGEQVRLDLDRGKTINYIGGALVHANGFVYVVSQAHLYKIEPDTMTVVRSTDLPTARYPFGRLTIFNGLSTCASGHLLTKFFAIKSNQSRFLMIDPDTLAVVSSVEYPGASPRLALAPTGGTEYLYHLNKRETFRMSVGAGSLALDPAWKSRFDPYATGQPENEEPTSPVIANGRAFYTTNTLFTSPEPMRIFSQPVDQAHGLDDPPLGGEDLFEAAAAGGWSFFHLSIDEDTGIIIGNDQGNGLLCAVRRRADGTLERLWQVPLRVSARPAIVTDRQMVYATDFRDGHNHLVALDLITGREMLRVPTPATRATIATIIPATNGDVYFGSNEPGRDCGLFHRVYVSRAG